MGRAMREEYDFDRPEAVDLERLKEVVRELRLGRQAWIPGYSFERHAREEKENYLYGAAVVIVEGEFIERGSWIGFEAEAEADCCFVRM